MTVKRTMTMQLELTSDALTKALAFVSRSIEPRKVSGIPALGAVVITAADTTATFTVDTVDIAATAVIEIAEVREPGRVAVPAKQLARLVGNFAKKAPVTIATTGQAAAVASGRSRYRLPVIPLEGLPQPFAPGKGAAEVELDKDTAAHLFKTWFAVAPESDPRGYMTGVFLHRVGDELIAVATDGHTLAKASTPHAVDFPNIIIPARTVNEIVRLGDDVRLRCDAKVLEVRAANRTLCSKLIDATYPSYQRAIPVGGNWVDIDRAALIAGLERLAAVTVPSAPAGICWDSDGVMLSLPREQDTADDWIAATAAGACHTAVSIAKMLKLLDVLDADLVRLDAASDNVPLRVSIPGQEDVLVVLMPIRVVP